jgi:D-alanine-D-alanine ligase-like ATP-grasp enzyme
VEPRRIDIVDGRVSTQGFTEHIRTHDEGSDLLLVPQTHAEAGAAGAVEPDLVGTDVAGSDVAVAELYSRLLARTADPVAFLAAVEAVANGSGAADDCATVDSSATSDVGAASAGRAILRIRLDRSGQIAALPQPSPRLTVTTDGDGAPQTLTREARTPVSTVLLEQALVQRGAQITRTSRNYLVGSGPDGRPLLIKDARSSLNGMPAVHSAEQKDVARTLLHRAGVAVPAGRAFDRTADPAEALDLLDELGTVVVKPVDGDKGRGVTVGVRDEAQLREAWELALHETRAGILVEEVRVGDEVRILVLDGRAHAAARRVPPHVTGDGRRTIRELVNATNAQRHGDFFLHGKPIALTPHRLRRLADAGLTPLSVLAAGQRCDLDVTGNLRTGAVPQDVTESLHPSYLRIAEDAVAAIPGLRSAGVDVIAAYLSAPAGARDHVILEINPNPGLGIHAGARGVGACRAAGALARAFLDSCGPGAALHSASAPDPQQIPESVSSPSETSEATSLGPAASARSPDSACPSETEDAGHQALAHAFAARGLAIESLGPRLFVAQDRERVHGVVGTLTDLSAHAAVFALRNPNVVAELLGHRRVPVVEGRAFIRSEQEAARQWAAQWDRVAVHGGGHHPLVVDTASDGAFDQAFDAAWTEAAGHATMPGMRVSRAPVGQVVRVLVAHSVVLDVRDEHAQVARDDRTEEIAREAVAALPGLDLAEVVIAPAPTGPAVLHMRADPDLRAFCDGAERTLRELASTIVDLHLTACSGRAE